MRVILFGHPAAGKTTLGPQIAKRTGLEYQEGDKWLEKVGDKHTHDIKKIVEELKNKDDYILGILTREEYLKKLFDELKINFIIFIYVNDNDALYERAAAREPKHKFLKYYSFDDLVKWKDAQLKWQEKWPKKFIIENRNPVDTIVKITRFIHENKVVNKIEDRSSERK